MATSRPLILTVAIATSLVSVFGMSSANAAGAGFGDVSDAMVYGPSSPLGSPLTALINQDNASTTFAAPWAINFFGTKYEGLCVTTNGTISPVLTPTTSCSDEYDEDLENLALAADAPLIAALALDLDPSKTLWVPGVAISSLSIAAGVATFTTAAPHPFVTGGTGYFYFPDGDPTFQNNYLSAAVTVVDSTSFTFATPQADAPTRSVAGASASIGTYVDTRDDTNADGLADDGFGAVKQVYYGVTTIGGKSAVVITWYRVPTHNGANSPLLSNTLQVVLIQEPTVGATAAGYDFTIQINIGTATDNDDGYSFVSPASSCDGNPAGIADCRWGMGWADFDGGDPNTPSDDTATPFELFGASPINSLVDNGGSTALVRNRLNSEVLGRYTWQMVGGVTTGFARPTMDGRDAGPFAAAPAPSPGTPSPAAPELAATGSDNGVIVGAAGVLLFAGLGLTVLGRRRTTTTARR